MMNAEKLKLLQAPLKALYRERPEEAKITLKVEGRADPGGIVCHLETGQGPGTAGLHPAAGGSGDELCSGDMLLEALVACAGVTFKAVATALEVPVRSAIIRAEGDLDFRGTLGVAKEVPVGFTAIRLSFDIEAPGVPQEKIDSLVKLTERYCVVFQTLASKPTLVATSRRIEDL